MIESIKFVNDDARGNYSKNGTGTMVAITRDYTNRVVGIVRLESGKYVEAVLGDIEYVAAG